MEGPSPEERRQLLRPVFPEEPLPEGIRLRGLDAFHLMPDVIQDAVPAIGLPPRFPVRLEEGPQVYEAMLYQQGKGVVFIAGIRFERFGVVSSRQRAILVQHGLDNLRGHTAMGQLSAKQFVVPLRRKILGQDVPPGIQHIEPEGVVLFELRDHPEHGLGAGDVQPIRYVLPQSFCLLQLDVEPEVPGQQPLDVAEHTAWLCVMGIQDGNHVVRRQMLRGQRVGINLEASEGGLPDEHGVQVQDLIAGEPCVHQLSVRRVRLPDVTGRQGHERPRKRVVLLPAGGDRLPAGCNEPGIDARVVQHGQGTLLVQRGHELRTQSFIGFRRILQRAQGEDDLLSPLVTPGQQVIATVI